jgi:hypothetical protein
MADISKYFGQGVKNTLYLKNGVNFYHKGPWVQVFEDTEIDRWYVGDFCSASYQVSAEFGSNKKETLQILVVARPDQANYTIYGRASIDDPLVDISVSVNNGYLSLKMSASDPAYLGTKVIYIASYAGTVNTLIPATNLSFLIPDNLGTPGTGGQTPGSGTGSTIDLSSVNQGIVPDVTNQYNIGTNNKRWKSLFLTSSIDIGGVTLSKSTTGAGLDFPTGSTIGGLPLGIFSKISVPGADDVVANTENTALNLIAGPNIIITTDALSNTVTITGTGSGGGGGAVVSGGNSFQTISISGQGNVVADRPSDVLTLVAGSGIVLTTNPASDAITISSTGGGAGGGTSNQIIVTPVTTGEYPLVVAAGLDTVSPQSLYGKTSITVDIDNDLLNVTAIASRWADLAEKYLADADYEPGTVLEFGGDFEVTIAKNDTRRVAGIVSTDPGFIMNRDLKETNTALVALQGRVPCKIIGPVLKGDLIVSAGNGYAKSCADPRIGSVIGKSLEDFDGDTGIIEVAVGRL